MRQIIRIILYLLIFINGTVWGQEGDSSEFNAPCIELGKLEQELKPLTKKIEQNPNDHPQNYLERARLNANIADLQRACYAKDVGTGSRWRNKDILRDLNKAIFLGLETAEIYLLRGRYHCDNDNFTVALQDFLEAYELNSNQRAEYYYYRAKSFHGLEKRKEALSDFNKAVEMSPTEGRFIAARGMIKIELHDSYGAIQDLERSIQVNPSLAKNFSVIAYIVALRTGLEYYEGAQNFIDLTEKQLSSDPLLLNRRAELKQKMRDLEGALSDLNKALALCRKNHSCDAGLLRELYSLRGDTKFLLSDLPGALSDQDEVIKLGHYGNTDKDIKGAAQTFDNSDAYYKKARYKTFSNDLAGGMNEINKAIKFYEDVHGDTIRQDRSQAAYRELRAWIKFSMGDLQGSYRDYLEAWEFDKYESIRLRQVAFIQIKLNNIPAAIEFLQQAKFWGMEQDPDLLNDLGNYLNEVEKYKEAREYLKKCIEIEPEFLDAYLGLATASFYLQNKALTDSYVSEARTLAKKDGADHLSIEMLKKAGSWGAFLPKKRKALTALL